MNEKEYLEKLDDEMVHITTRPYLNKVLSHKEPYEVSVYGKSITVFPGVMSPKYDWAGLFMIECLPQSFAGQDVLELGPGSGLVSIFVALRGANMITAADIHPDAVENTRMNFERHAIKNYEVIVSDVFSGLQKKKFDSIIFNLPYHNGIPKNNLEKGVIDSDYKTMKTFFSEAKQYLKKKGKLYVGFSRSGNTSMFIEQVEKNGLRIEMMTERNVWDDPIYFGSDFHYNCQVYRMSFTNM